MQKLSSHQWSPISRSKHNNNTASLVHVYWCSFKLAANEALSARLAFHTSFRNQSAASPSEPFQWEVTVWDIVNTHESRCLQTPPRCISRSFKVFKAQKKRTETAFLSQVWQRRKGNHLILVRPSNGFLCSLWDCRTMFCFVLLCFLSEKTM